MRNERSPGEGRAREEGVALKTVHSLTPPLFTRSPCGGLSERGYKLNLAETKLSTRKLTDLPPDRKSQTNLGKHTHTHTHTHMTGRADEWRDLAEGRRECNEPSCPQAGGRASVREGRVGLSP